MDMLAAMETAEVIYGLVVWFIGTAAVMLLADRYRRSDIVWGLAAIFMSPVLVGLVLFGVGPRQPSRSH